MKVVINTCYGGFGLSHAGVMRYAELKGITMYSSRSVRSTGVSYIYEPCGADCKDRIVHHTKPLVDGNIPGGDYFWASDLERGDPILVQVVEELGNAADGDYSELKVVDVPDDVTWYIEEYDGKEHVAERHLTWS